MQENSNARQHNLPNLPVTVRRENTEGLEDKFGKFCLPSQGEGRHKYRMFRILFKIAGFYLMLFF